MENPVERAVQKVGGPSAASFLLHVSVGAIYKWRRQGFVSDARSAVLLSQATEGAVTIAELAGLEIVTGGAPSPKDGRRARRGRQSTARSLRITPSVEDVAANARAAA